MESRGRARVVSTRAGILRDINWHQAVPGVHSISWETEGYDTEESTQQVLGEHRRSWRGKREQEAVQGEHQQEVARLLMVQPEPGNSDCRYPFPRKASARISAGPLRGDCDGDLPFSSPSRIKAEEKLVAHECRWIKSHPRRATS